MTEATLIRVAPHIEDTKTEYELPQEPPRVLLPLATWQAIERPPLRYDWQWPEGVEMPY